LNATPYIFSLKSIYIDFREITKARLAISVVFSSVAGLCSVFMICILRLDGVEIGARWVLYVGVKRFQSNYRKGFGRFNG
jgi:hypothetical protein